MSDSRHRVVADIAARMPDGPISSAGLLRALFQAYDAGVRARILATSDVPVRTCVCGHPTASGYHSNSVCAGGFDGAGNTGGGGAAGGGSLAAEGHNVLPFGTGGGLAR